MQWKILTKKSKEKSIHRITCEYSFISCSVFTFLFLLIRKDSCSAIHFVFHIPPAVPRYTSASALSSRMISSSALRNSSSHSLSFQTMVPCQVAFWRYCT